MGKMNGMVFDIEKFATKDGPGIRTAVFLKGCPLRCLWCHNPESLDATPEIFFEPSLCVDCGYCFNACPQACHRKTAEGHLFDRTNCVRCGLCARNCRTHALEVIGREMSVSEVIEELMKDKAFYDVSGGGLTFSGGEPMFQFDFTLALAKAAKDNGLHICMETCGFAPNEHYAEIMPLIDIFLFDLKECDEAKHLEYTGVPLAPILENLDFLNAHGAKVFLRCPLIPGLNARPDHFKFIGDLASRLSGVAQVDVELYHPLGLSKSKCIGKAPELPSLSCFPDKEEANRWVEAIKSFTAKPVAVS